ncbi:MAG TPA: NAD(P)-dependent oxidoreductase [Acidimicrobiales bacterium]|jgi:3-hydroxyisobutyrate dehydrogenase
MESESSPPTVGVIGLGDIGSGVAKGLGRAGIDLVVCDVRPESTAPFADRARVAADPADLGAIVDVVVIAVVTDDQVLSVLDGPGGALSRARPGTTVLIVSTVAPSTVAKVAELSAACGVRVADCGVSGGPSSAAEGMLVSMVGGDDDVVERIRPVLDAFSSLVVRMGPLGSGLQAKLARNLVQYASWLAAYEAQVLAEAAGIELAKLAQVIRASDARIGGASTLMFRRTVAPFSADDDEGLVNAMRTAATLAHKDLRAAMELAAGLGIELPLAAMTDDRADALFGIGPDTARTAGTGTGGAR